MKKKILSFLLTICLIMPCVFLFSACEKEPPENPPTTPTTTTPQSIYTVSESEWEINFNITNGLSQPEPQAEPQALLCSSLNNPNLIASHSAHGISEITSYTLHAVGVSENVPGEGLLKIAPNGMYMEFYLNGELCNEVQNGTTPSSDDFYIGMTTMLKSFFPFSGKYDRFTFNQTKNAYVTSEMKVTVIDEDDINDTYDLFLKTAEVKFINGYLNTVTVDFSEDNTYGNPYLSLVFTFSNINNTTVNI